MNHYKNLFCIFTAAVCFASGAANASAADNSDSSAIAVKAAFSELNDDDRFIIVFDEAEMALSRFAQDIYLAGVPVECTERGISRIPENAAVFRTEKNSDGSVMLHSDDGYLTAAKSGTALTLVPEAGSLSQWQCADDIISCPAASYSDQKACLEFYSTSSSFSTYRMSESADPSPFSMSFYKLPDSYTVPDNSGGFRLPVFETSDIHGYMVDTSKAENEYRLAFIADKVNDAREKAGGEDNVILLDGGDIYQGNTLSNLLGGKPLSQAFDMMKYDAVALGNHEFDWGVENVVDADATMMDYSQENTVPVLISDLYKDGSKPGFTKDHIILSKNAVDESGSVIPVKIGVIGFADDYSSSIMPKMFGDAGYSIIEDYDALRKEAAELKNVQDCDAVVVLAHSEAAYIAENIGVNSGIDLVLGGHTHYNSCGESRYGVEYVQPAGQCNAYAYTELIFDKDENGEPVFRNSDSVSAASISKNASLLRNTPENAENLDTDIVAVCDDATARLSDVLNEKIGRITVSADRFSFIPGSGERASACGNWHCSIISRAVGADVGFFNQHGIRDSIMIPDGQEYRDVTLSDLYTLFPFSNKIYCFELSYEELLKLFDYALTENGSGLFSLVSGIDCYYTGQTVNALVLGGETLYANGEWFADKESKIRIAASEFLCTTDRIDNGMHNPLTQWLDSERLISSDTNDIDGAVEVLKKESAENSGYLFIDEQAHFIESGYTVPEKEDEPDTPAEEAPAVTTVSETQTTTAASTASVTTSVRTTSAAPATTKTAASRSGAPKTGDRTPAAAAVVMTAALIITISCRKKH